MSLLKRTLAWTRRSKTPITPRIASNQHHGVLDWSVLCLFGMPVQAERQLPVKICIASGDWDDIGQRGLILCIGRYHMLASSLLL